MPERLLYNHLWFRSQLEVQWAAFFDAIALPYQYEPKTAPLASGWFVPDFYIPRLRVYIEVKDDFDQATPKRYQELVSTSGDPLIFITGRPSPRNYCVSLFVPKRFHEFYPPLSSCNFAGFPWDDGTLWLSDGQNYMKLKRQWERPCKRGQGPIQDCDWIQIAMQKALTRSRSFTPATAARTW